MDDAAARARAIQNVAQACTYCKSRHSKCDGQVPCGQCTRRGRGNECSYAAVRKRGPKPKKDLYEYCNKLLVELEVQKQIAEYWKDQFAQAMKGKEDPLIGSVTFPVLTDGPIGSNNGNKASPTSPPLDPNRPKFSVERSSSPHEEDEEDDDMDISGSGVDNGNNNISPNMSNVSSPYASGASSPATRPAQQPQYPPIKTDPFGSNSLQTQAMSAATPFHHPADLTELTVDMCGEIALGFLEIMLPVIPELTFAPSPLMMFEAYNATRAEFEAIPPENYHHLVGLLESAVIGAFGSRCVAAPTIMRQFAKKAEELMHVLFFQREVQSRSDVANRLVGALVLLSFYYTGDERQGSKQSVIMLAYQIVSLHRKQIPPASMFRIYTVMMGLADTQEDRNYWSEQSSAIVKNASIDLVTAQIFSGLMFVIACLHPKMDWSVPYPKFTPQELAALQDKLLIVDYFLTTVAVPSRDPAHIDFFDPISTIRLVYLGARLELHYLMGEYEQAKKLVYAAAILASTLHRPHNHTFIFGIHGAVDVAIRLNMPTNVIRELHLLLLRSYAVLPGAARLVTQLADHLRQTDPQAERFLASAVPKGPLPLEQRFERADKVMDLIRECPLPGVIFTANGASYPTTSLSFVTHKAELDNFAPRMITTLHMTLSSLTTLRHRIREEIAAYKSGVHVDTQGLRPLLPTSQLVMSPFTSTQQQQYIQQQQQQNTVFLPSPFEQPFYGGDALSPLPSGDPLLASSMTFNAPSPYTPVQQQQQQAPLAASAAAQQQQQPQPIDIESFFNSSFVNFDYNTGYGNNFDNMM